MWNGFVFPFRVRYSTIKTPCKFYLIYIAFICIRAKSLPIYFTVILFLKPSKNGGFYFLQTSFYCILSSIVYNIILLYSCFSLDFSNIEDVIFNIPTKSYVVSLGSHGIYLIYIYVFAESVSAYVILVYDDLPLFSCHNLEDIFRTIIFQYFVVR